MNGEPRVRLRLANEINGTAGTLIGFVAGIVVSIPALLIVAMMAGKDREVLALGLMFYVVPFGAVVGVIAGAIAGSRGRLKRLVNGSAGVFAVVYVASLVISAWQDEQAEQVLHPRSNPTAAATNLVTRPSPLSGGSSSRSSDSAARRRTAR